MVSTDEKRDGISVRPSRYDSAEAAPLVEEANADLAQRYSAQLARYGGQHMAGLQNEASLFVPPRGCFFVAQVDGRPAGCGGWVGYGTSGDAAELKKLYVAPAVRHRGVARALLSAIESSAREHGRRQMLLEAGVEQPEALTLYESAGYRLIENYGYFRDFPEARSFARDL